MKVSKSKFTINKKKIIKEFKRDWQLWLLVLIPLIYIIIFDYGPMYGLQIAFRDYRPKGGISGSEWVGLKWFKQFLSDYSFETIFNNTWKLSLYNLLVTFPLPVVFALMVNALRGKKYKKVIQTVSYMPHFISMTVMIAIVQMVLNPVTGIYGNAYRLFGGTGYPVDFRSLAPAFRHIYVISGVWQSLGWSSIIYVAALSSVSPELHEAAKIDGASRFKRILYVDFPTILPTIMIMLIMRCGQVLGVGFEKAYLLQSTLNLKTSEVISTYVYKYGMAKVRNFSYATAIGLFNLAINLVVLVTVNWISKKSTDDEVSLF